MPLKRLNELRKGERGKVAAIDGGHVGRRLMDMGLTSGSEIEMQGVAPMGDPIEIKVRGYNLSLRKSEAASVKVEVPE